VLAGQFAPQQKKGECMLARYIEKILKARVYDVAEETPLEFAPQLSERLDNRVLLKREGLQPVYSFKLRGAYNKLRQLDEAERKRGVIAASAGNHAQGVALSAARLGIKALIVMPKTTPAIKVDAVRRHGAKIVLYGDTYDSACEHANELAASKGLVFIHPYDDVEVIAGQGTIGMEILRQIEQPPDAIFVPVGGGGLIAGVAAYVKYLHPEIKIIGVEPVEAACLQAALAKGRRVRLKEVGIFADGVAVRQVGKEPFKVAREYVDEVITVSTDEICAAIKDLFEDTRAISEPAGALAVAGLKKYVATSGVTRQTLVAIDSGSNINFDRLRHVTERAEVGEGREALLAVTIPEQAGSFHTFCRALGERNITEFNYRYFDQSAARVFAGIQLGAGDRGEKESLIQTLTAHGYPVVDMSDNEMAKVHVRYMVGGHAPQVTDEVLYRFEFPERPGALLNFLVKIGGRWNISLFHYRNHGAAYGRVLVGVQVAKRERSEFRRFLDAIGYNYRDETENPAYQLFVSAARHHPMQ
jgi:threonine dehydratase